MNTEPYLNSNMDQRPSNVSLLTNAIMQCLVSALTGGILTSAVLMFSRGLPFDVFGWSLLSLGMTLGVVIYLVHHFRYAKKQKFAYVSAGGDPTGINLFMFGAMGGKIRPDGIWQWHDPNSDY